MRELADALAILDESVDAEAWDSVMDDRLLPWKEVSQETRKVLGERRTHLHRVKEAVGNPTAMAGFPWEPSYEAEMPWLGHARKAAVLLVLQAKQYRAEGHPEDALANYGLGIDLSHAIGRKGALISTLVGYVGLGITFDLGVLDFVKDADTPRESLKEVIALCGEAEAVLAGEEWPLGEAAAFTTLATEIAEALETGEEESLRRVEAIFKDLLELDFTSRADMLRRLSALRITPESCRKAINIFAREMRFVTRACGKDDVRALQILKRRSKAHNKHPWLVGMVLPASERAAEERAKTRVRMRMPALLAAIRLHEMVRGNAPEDLEDLVPDYISSLPMDPFSRKPFGCAEDAKGRFLYSIGPDLVDHGGKLKWEPGDEGEGDWIWRLREGGSDPGQ